MFIMGSKFNPETRKREVLPGFEKACEIAYHIGLPGLECIEVQLLDGKHYFLYWKPGGDLLRYRLLSQRERAYLEHSYEHVDRYFQVLGSALGVSEFVLSRARTDAASLASAIRYMISVHDAHHGLIKSFLPIFPPDPFVEVLRLLVDRLEDVVEMAAIGEGLARLNRSALPAPQSQIEPTSHQ